MGDAIMAFWNAPLDDPQHPEHACSAAVEMAAKLEVLNRKWKQEAEQVQRRFRPVKIGIGINTGECCVGNLGSTYRFDYSAVGDQVNITSRLEGLTKIYGVTAVVGEGTLMRAKGISALELDIVTVKGREHPTRIYTLRGLLGADSGQLAALEQRQQELLDAYRRQRWDGACCALAACREINIPQLETYYSLFESRISALRNAPVPSDWDGSFAMTEK
jgi:adenylate cyclase